MVTRGSYHSNQEGVAMVTRRGYHGNKEGSYHGNDYGGFGRLTW